VGYELHYQIKVITEYIKDVRDLYAREILTKNFGEYRLENLVSDLNTKVTDLAKYGISYVEDNKPTHSLITSYESGDYSIGYDMINIFSLKVLLDLLSNEKTLGIFTDYIGKYSQSNLDYIKGTISNIVNSIVDVYLINKLYTEDKLWGVSYDKGCAKQVMKFYLDNSTSSSIYIFELIRNGAKVFEMGDINSSDLKSLDSKVIKTKFPINRLYSHIFELMSKAR
jgi:hypothetical protein